ncbi:MAG: hypothetical protein R3310_17550, partial [Candidatus Competibacteraceae bacterium]|nr:hypothetical protein [Candidatus Competibacteraceae bacterium]
FWPRLMPVKPRVVDTAPSQPQVETADQRRQADPPRLMVTAATGTVEQPLPLDIQAIPGNEQDTLSVDIAGLPPGFTLSAGRRYSPDIWTLTPEELTGLKLRPAGQAKDFTLTVTATAIPPFAGASTEVSAQLPVAIAPAPLGDQARVEDRVGKTALEEPLVEQMPAVVADSPLEDAPVESPPQEAPTVETGVTGPEVIEAPPQQQDEVVARQLTPPQEIPPTQQQDSPLVQDLAAVEPSPSVVAFMASGDRMMERGDPLGARLFYEVAARTGDPRAATAVGRTFDPVEMERRGLPKTDADSLLAGQWYLRGLEGQDPEAERRLQALRGWLLEHRGADDKQLLALDRLLSP